MTNDDHIWRRRALLVALAWVGLVVIGMALQGWRLCKNSSSWDVTTAVGGAPNDSA